MAPETGCPVETHISEQRRSSTIVRGINSSKRAFCVENMLDSHLIFIPYISDVLICALKLKDQTRLQNSLQILGRPLRQARNRKTVHIAQVADLGLIASRFSKGVIRVESFFKANQ